MPPVDVDGTQRSGEFAPVRSNRAWIAMLRRWWFVPVLLVAIVELGLHLKQTHSKIRPEDWSGARAFVQSQVQPNDLVLVAPSWLGPVGRMQLGDALITTRRAARADESRFQRAFEVALGSGRDGALRSWPVEEETLLGQLTVRRLRNPMYRPVIDDLVEHAQDLKAEVSNTRSGKEAPCPWSKGVPATGHLGFGPAAPGERFHCPGNAWVAETVLADLDYRPRRCIYAPPPSKAGVLRLKFKEVRFGKRLEGHHALYVEAERDGKGAPVRILFSSEGKKLGEATHLDGQGWVGFGFDTPALDGTSGELVAEVSSEGNRRMYCFEVTTR